MCVDSLIVCMYIINYMYKHTAAGDALHYYSYVAICIAVTAAFNEMFFVTVTIATYTCITMYIYYYFVYIYSHIAMYICSR